MTNDPLRREQDYLSHARAELSNMRKRTESLKAQAGNKVSSEILAATLYHRARSLRDDPATTLFFGRTDHDDGERWYIGRRHVADSEGDPVVIDWRAEVARAFYRASRTARMGVTRRRRFGVELGQITAFEDEHLIDPDETDTRSKILSSEIERPRVGPMRDIVATIQPEQDVIVRADVDTSVCIQGAPGTGKTAVGLHRAAWLLYAHRARLERSGVLVVGPNDSFLAHIGLVLPTLGEAQVRHATVESLVLGQDGGGPPLYRVRGTDPTTVAGLKGDIRMAAVLRNAVWSSIRPPTEPLVVLRGARTWRIPAGEVAEIIEELRTRGVRYASARGMLPQRLAHEVLVRMEDAGDICDDRVQDAVARSREVRTYVDAAWPALKVKTVLWKLFSDPETLVAASTGVLDDAERRLLQWPKPPRAAGSATWTAADTVLLDELTDLFTRRSSLGHVVLDEAQDLSPMQLRAVGRRCPSGSMTVLGDIAQGTTPWSTQSWTEALDHLGQPAAVLDVLDRGFRVPAAVIDYAARLLPAIAPGLSAPTSVRDEAGSLRFDRVEPGERWSRLAAAVERDLLEPGSVGVIVPDDWLDDAAEALVAAGLQHEVLGRPHQDETGDPAVAAEEALLVRVSLVPAKTAKGLEYDRVIVLEPARIAAAEPDERTGLRRLYVVLTRAVSALTVIHSQPLPALLA